jgi:hypothetical protein
MTDWIDEIEARVLRDLTPCDKHPIAARWMSLPIGDYDRLIARVRELSARNEALERVANSAAGVEANAFEEPSDYTGDDWRFTVPGVRMVELRAALVALKEEE